MVLLKIVIIDSNIFFYLIELPIVLTIELPIELPIVLPIELAPIGSYCVPCVPTLCSVRHPYWLLVYRLCVPASEHGSLEPKPKPKPPRQPLKALQKVPWAGPGRLGAFGGNFKPQI